MAGRIKLLIDSLVTLRSQSLAGTGHFVRAHLILNGINPDRYNARSEDDPVIVHALEKMISDFRAQRT